MSDWFIFFLAVLFSFRVAVMFSKESGPGRIFKKFRAKAPPGSATREGLSCTLCESVWWAAIVTVTLCLMGLVAWKIAPIYWFAVSGGAVCLNQQFTTQVGK